MLNLTHDWRWTLCTLLSGALLLSGGAAAAQLAENNPRLSLPNSRLHRDYEAPIFLTGHLGLGGAFQLEQGQLDYGASFIFRPGSSANFFQFLEKMNTAMVLRIDHQATGPQSRLFSGDLVFRRYLGDRGSGSTEVLPFFGVGIGATDAVVPASVGGNSRYWSWLLEAGQEWYFRPNVLLVARFQYRHFSYGATFVTTWAVSGAVGIPVPW